MKHSIFILTGIFVYTTISSCKKTFLDVPVTQNIVAEDYVVNLSSSEEFLSGLYLLTARDIYIYSTEAYADLAADNLKDLGGLMDEQYSWMMIADQTTSSSNMNSLWVNGYKIIRSCNFLLERIDLYREENPQKADAIKGQALALRALLHSVLVNIFAQPYNFTADASHAGIPYITSYSQTKQLDRKTVKDVYDNVISDFNRALELVPSTLVSQAAMNRNAIKALLSRTYLFKKDFGKSKELAREISLQIPIMPISSYPAKLFTVTDKESIFWLLPAQTSNTSPNQTRFQGDVFNSTTYFSATADLVNLIKERPGDTRNTWFSSFPTGNWQIKKFPIGAIAGITDADRAYYQTVIRSSEIYLTAAECYSQLNNQDSARYFVNAIRTRANIPALTSTITGPALLDSIFKERRKELCFEGLRLFDLLRNGKEVKRADVISPAPSILSYPNDKFIAPIPIIDVNVYGWGQNPGYN